MFGKMFELILICLTLVATTNLPQVGACGPGRGIGGPRRMRKLTPLVFKQHDPNYEEYSGMASGVITGIITRNDSIFNKMIMNYNPLIDFRDDEGTGADRVMTPRLSERLNTLAISVVNLWPTTKLRVIEAWDEDYVHGERSLHYEGRAVDIQTSDRDRTKNGMLARLAVESRFDWVYYEGKGHIHCSVKSDSYGSRTSGCFTGFSTVKTETGEIRKLNELKLGEKILSMDDGGNPIYSEVILFMDRDRAQIREFVKLTTDSNDTILLTPSHLLYVWRHAHSGVSNYLFADRIIVGDFVLVNIDNRLKPRQIVSISYERHIGVYAPLTREGTIVVNSILASCYALVDSQSIAHYSFTPIRVYNSIHNFWFGGATTVKRNETTKSIDINNDNMDSLSKYGQNGIHWYAKLLYSIKDYCLPNHWLYQT